MHRGLSWTTRVTRVLRGRQGVRSRLGEQILPQAREHRASDPGAAECREPGSGRHNTSGVSHFCNYGGTVLGLTQDMRMSEKGTIWGSLARAALVPFSSAMAGCRAHVGGTHTAVSSRGGERPGAEHGLHWSGEDCVPGAECRDTQKEGTLGVALHRLGTQSCPQWAAQGGLLRTRCPCHTCDIREGLDSRGHKDHIVWSRVQIRGTRAQCSGGSSPDSEDLSHHLPLQGDRKSHATAPDTKHLKPTMGLPAPRAEAQGDGEREHCWHTGRHLTASRSSGNYALGCGPQVTQPLVGRRGRASGKDTALGLLPRMTGLQVGTWYRQSHGPRPAYLPQA